MEKDQISNKRALKQRSQYLGQDLVDMLTAPTPTEPDEFGKWIEERPARGGAMVKYVPGFRFIQRLNDCFGFLWSHTVKDSFEKDGHIVSLDRVTVQIPGRTVVKEYRDDRGEPVRETIRFDGLTIEKEQFGSSEIKRYSNDVKDKKGTVKYHKGDIIDLGDDYKGASTDAMKKCATGFGMFLDVYGPRENTEGMASKAQLDALYMRGEQAGMTKEETVSWAEGELGGKLSSADPLEVMGLIPKLLDMAKEKEAG